MIATYLLLASASLLQAAKSLSLPDDKVLVKNILVPKETSSFKKNNVSAQWAPGYPKEWGSEDYYYQFNTPDPEVTFESMITQDEKYLVMLNGTHVRFIDLEKNSTASTLTLAMPDGNPAWTVRLHPAPQDGYYVLVGGSSDKYDISVTVRIHLSSDLKPVGESSIYQGGIGDISKQSKVASLDGYIYDLEGTDTPVATLEGRPDITYLSFSPDGVHLASVSYRDKTVDLWNVTPGQNIYRFPGAQTIGLLATQFSPDGRYMMIVVSKAIQIYTLSNMTAPPTELKGFNTRPRDFVWSPDSKTFAVSDDGRLQIFEIASLEVVQKWEAENCIPGRLSFLDDGKKLVWGVPQGVWYLYDFERNVRWLWTYRVTDRVWGSNMEFSWLSKKNMAVTHDGDSTVRFWKL